MEDKNKHKQVLFDQLPLEILENIFSKCESDDKKQLLLVNKNLNRIYEKYKRLNTFIFEDINETTTIDYLKWRLGFVNNDFESEDLRFLLLKLIECNNIIGFKYLYILNKNNRYKNDLYLYAAKLGNLPILKYLDEHGEHMEIFYCIYELTYFDYDYLRKNRKSNNYIDHPCINAAQHGHFECLKYIIEKYIEYFHPNYYNHNYDYSKRINSCFIELIKYICKISAENGHLNCLELIHSYVLGVKYDHYDQKKPMETSLISYFTTKNCHFDCFSFCYKNGYSFNLSFIIKKAIEKGKIDIIKYFIENKEKYKCEFNEEMILNTVIYNRFDYFKFLHENSFPWNHDIYIFAIREGGHLNFLEYAYEHSCPISKRLLAWCYQYAATHGHIHCLKFLDEKMNCIPFDDITEVICRSYLKYISYSNYCLCSQYEEEHEDQIFITREEEHEDYNIIDYCDCDCERCILVESKDCMEKYDCDCNKCIMNKSEKIYKCLFYIFNKYQEDKKKWDKKHWKFFLKKLELFINKYSKKHICPWKNFNIEDLTYLILYIKGNIDIIKDLEDEDDDDYNSDFSSDIGDVFESESDSDI
jgi:hypothetical protein